MSRRPAWWPLPHVLRAGAESPFIDHHRPAATVGHLPQTADTVQPEVAATEDHLAVQLDAPDMCPPLGENLPASDGLCRRRLMSPCQYMRAARNVRLFPGKYASGCVFTASTRPHAHLPSLKGTPQNCPGRRCAFDVGSNGYYGMGTPHP